MKTYNLLDLVIGRLTNTDIYFFYNVEDAERTIGGQLICGNIEDNSNYLSTTEAFDDVKCDAVIHSYGDFTYLYKIEP